MKQERLRSTLSKIAVFIAAVSILGASAFAVGMESESVLHSFNGTRGEYPIGGLVADAYGNLYGITSNGGTYNLGVAYMLSPNLSGGWTETVLHNFGNTKAKDGATPTGNLVLDSAGNLYGVTIYGGAYGAGNGDGTVYKLSPAAGGKWTETILYNFSGGTGLNNDGYWPEAGVVFDSAGNLYGTLDSGGSFDEGAVFELSPVSGVWTENIIWSFSNTDGNTPYGGVVIDSAGNLYGTASSGGNNGYGVVFELSPSGSGWVEDTLHYFGGFHDGRFPWGSLVLDAAGNLYGVTSAGGPKDYGTVYELSPASGGTFTEAVLHSFNSGADGAEPYAQQLALDAAGNLYGTTLQGGAIASGIVFKLSPTLSGPWTETLLHAFNGSGGASPYAGVLLVGTGVYGTTGTGGTSGMGVVYEIHP